MSGRDYVTVREVMTADPHVIDGLATVREAMNRMRDESVNSLVIERRYEGDEYGIVVVGDIADHIIGRNRSPDRTNVYEIMSKPVVSLEANMDIKYAVRLLARFGLSRAIVLEKGDLIGIVTLRDLVFRYIPTRDES